MYAPQGVAPMGRERSQSGGGLLQAPPARTIYGYAPAPPPPYPRSASQVFPGGAEVPYPSPPCDCAECFARPSSSSGMPHVYSAPYSSASPYSNPYGAPAGLAYPVDEYRQQTQVSYVEQPVYRPIPRPAEYAISSHSLPPAPLPSPPIEDQLPHLHLLPPYRANWVPTDTASSFHLPDPPAPARQPSLEHCTPYQPRTSLPSPFLPAPVSLPSTMDRRRSSGASQPETTVSRSPSGLAVYRTYGSEYSFGSDEGVEERTTTPFMTKLHYLVHNLELAEVIRWNADGTALVFAHASPQLSDALARVFRHGNTHSFVRQLNIYDFKRLSSLELHAAVESSRPIGSRLTSADFSGFCHPLFFRDSPGRACDLTRLKPKMGKKPSTKNLASAAKAAAVFTAAGNAGRPRSLRSEGKFGGGMKGRKLV
ncbi:hypothetical protein JCM3770_006587 [Rhodotorula araucariae]